MSNSSGIQSEEYEMWCDCDKPVKTKVSWTEHNPGRRYAVCKGKREKCDFKQWLEPSMNEREKQIMHELMDRNLTLRDRIDDAEQKNDALLKQIKEKEDTIDELESKIENMELQMEETNDYIDGKVIEGSIELERTIVCLKEKIEALKLEMVELMWVENNMD